MARMQPVVAAGHDDLLARRAGGCGRDFREALQLGLRDNAIFHAVGRAPGPLRGTVPGGVNHARPRLQPLVRRQGIGGGWDVDQSDAAHKPDGAEHVFPLGLGEFRGGAREPAQ